MNPYRISAISYANSLPFVYGLKKFPHRPAMQLMVDIPSECARKLGADEADIGLVPVAALPGMKYFEILPGYCIGGTGKVRTVILASTVELREIKSIRLDYQSRTSVQLVRLLARDYWKISPQWKVGTPEDEHRSYHEGEARLVIGDRAFLAEKQFPHLYDLAENWNKWTGLPFVFAVWAANKPIHPDFIKMFYQTLQYGVLQLAKVSSMEEARLVPSHVNLIQYYSENISFPLDNNKIRGLKKFLDLLPTLNEQ